MNFSSCLRQLGIVFSGKLPRQGRKKGILLQRVLSIPFVLIGSVALAQSPSIETLKHGVVKITATNPNRVGTGVIVGLKGNTAYIATASHVIEGDPSPQVTFYTQRSKFYHANVEGIDGGNPKGLAVLRVEGDFPKNVLVLELDPSFSIPDGSLLTIIGFPRIVGVPWAPVPGTMIGFRGPVFVFSGAVDEGNSGGPVLFEEQVVGVVMEAGNGFGNAVPSSIVRLALEGWKIPLDAVAKCNDHPQILPKIKTGKDGAPMVLVPAGTFTMGGPKGVEIDDDRPKHEVCLKDFYIDQYEVTVMQYQRFLTATTRSAPKYWDQVESRRDGRKPVIGVDWHDANAYCIWAEKRLPTEAEWEKAARGTRGNTFPWGEHSPMSNLANFGKSLGHTSNNIYSEKLKIVGSFELGKSPFGVYDMAGNALEWVADVYDKNYYKNSPKENPRGPNEGDFRVLRGGSWDMEAQYLGSTQRYRSYLKARDESRGFRCAQDAR